MNQTKFIRLLSNLSQVEVKRFSKCIHSPYFNTHKDTVRLFELIYAAYPDFKADKLKASLIFTQLYPDEAFDESKLRTLRKYLLKKLYEFLGYQEMEKDSLGFELKQLESLIHRRDHKFFEHQVKQFDKKLVERSTQSSPLFLNTFLYENLKMYYYSTHQSRWEKKDFNKTNQALDHYYLAERLRLYCSELNEQELFVQKTQSDFLIESILTYCELNFESLPLLIRIYYCMVLLRLNSKNEQHYLNIKRKLPQLHKLFERTDQINVYNYLINFCYQYYKKGKLIYEQEMFDLYQNMLKQDLLFEEALLSSNHYKNLTTLGLRLGQFDWVKKFIEEYKVYIDLRYREGVFNYNMAHWHSYQENYSEALQHLQNVDFNDPFYRISHNLLLLKIYYESVETEAFMALCINFQNFIRRKKELSDSQREAYLNFIQSTRALFLIKIGQRHNLEKAIIRINESDNIIEKTWLLLKVEEQKH